MKNARAHGFRLPRVHRQTTNENALRTLSAQLLEDADSAVAAAIVHETQAHGRVAGEKRQKSSAAQPVLFVEARNDYADFLHIAKVERPGILRPIRARRKEMRPSSASRVASVRAFVSLPAHVAKSLGAWSAPATRSCNT